MFLCSKIPNPNRCLSVSSLWLSKSGVRAIPRMFCSILSSSGSQSSQKTYCPHDVISGLFSVQNWRLAYYGSAVSASSLWLYKQTTRSLLHGLLLSLSTTGSLKHLKHTEARPCSLSSFCSRKSSANQDMLLSLLFCWTTALSKYGMGVWYILLCLKLI